MSEYDEVIRERLTTETMTNPFLQELFAPYSAPRGLRHSDGSGVQFDLKDNQNLYRYWTGPNGAKYCWTPHADTKGWYWSFVYKPQGKGSRSGNACKFKLTNPVKFRKRKVAKQRAADRFNKVNS